MAKIFGRDMSKNDIRKRLGQMVQLADMQPCILEDGKGRGVRVIKVNTGSGLMFDILPDRGMDISLASFGGIPFSYMSQSDLCGPEFFTEKGDQGFLDNFFAGLLTTSGLSNIGASNLDNGKEYGLHGTISNIPASNVSVEKVWNGDEYELKAKGTMHQGRFKGENFEFTREIITSLGSKKFRIYDFVENLSFKEEPFMMMYHINFGYPFVSEDSKLFLPPGKVIPRTEHAKSGLSTYGMIETPTNGYEEQCFYHEFGEENIVAGFYNPTLGVNGLGVYLKYKKSMLPYFCQWKQMGEQEYVMGLIPGTWFAEGRNAARARNELKSLKPGEVFKAQLEIGVFDGSEKQNFFY